MKILYRNKEIGNTTLDYSQLVSKPSINGHEIAGAHPSSYYDIYKDQRVDELIAAARSVKKVSVFPTDPIPSTLYYVGPISSEGDVYNVVLVDSDGTAIPMGTSDIKFNTAGIGITIDTQEVISVDLPDYTNPLDIDSEGHLIVNSANSRAEIDDGLGYDSAVTAWGLRNYKVVGASDTTNGNAGIAPTPQAGNLQYVLVNGSWAPVPVSTSMSYDNALENVDTGIEKGAVRHKKFLSGNVLQQRIYATKINSTGHITAYSPWYTTDSINLPASTADNYLFEAQGASKLLPLVGSGRFDGTDTDKPMSGPIRFSGDGVFEINAWEGKEGSRYKNTLFFKTWHHPNSNISTFKEGAWMKLNGAFNSSQPGWFEIGSGNNSYTKKMQGKIIDGNGILYSDFRYSKTDGCYAVVNGMTSKDNTDQGAMYFCGGSWVGDGSSLVLARSDANSLSSHSEINNGGWLLIARNNSGTIYKLRGNSSGDLWTNNNFTVSKNYPVITMYNPTGNAYSDIRFNSSTSGFYGCIRAFTDGALEIGRKANSGTSWWDGAELKLWTSGGFTLNSYDGSSRYDLTGNTDGTLTWRGEQLATQPWVNNKFQVSWRDAGASWSGKVGDSWARMFILGNIVVLTFGCKIKSGKTLKDNEWFISNLPVPTQNVAFSMASNSDGIGGVLYVATGGRGEIKVCDGMTAGRRIRGEVVYIMSKL